MSGPRGNCLRKAQATMRLSSSSRRLAWPLLVGIACGCGSRVSVGEKIDPAPPIDAVGVDGSAGQKLPDVDENRGVTTSADPVVQVAAGAVNTCALHASGAVSCWGYGFGLTPTPVPPLEGAKHLAGGNAGGFLECAVMGDGSLRCLDAATPSAHAPALPIHDEIGLVTDAVKVTIGDSAACVVRASGKVSCTSPWQPSASRLHWPTVAAFAGAVDVHAGKGRVCAVRADDVVCMGTSRYADHLCAGSSTCSCGTDAPCSPEYGPFRVLTRAALLTPGARPFVAVRTNASYTVVRDDQGNVFLWGFDAQNPDRAEPNRIAVEDARLQRSNVAAIEIGGTSACDIQRGPADQGLVSCWGDNDFGQTGHPLVLSTVPISL